MVRINWGRYQLTNFQPNLTYSSILKYPTYYLSLLAEEGVALHGVVGVGRDEVEHVVVRSVRRAVGDPGCFMLITPLGINIIRFN